MAWPQAAATQPQPKPEIVTHEAPATFSSRINLVPVPVGVRGRHGRYVVRVVVRHTEGGSMAEQNQGVEIP